MVLVVVVGGGGGGGGGGGVGRLGEVEEVGFGRRRRGLGRWWWRRIVTGACNICCKSSL